MKMVWQSFWGIALVFSLLACNEKTKTTNSSSVDRTGARMRAQVAPSGAKIANEDESFNVPSNTLVFYGADSSWVQKTVSGRATCSNDFFGEDPLFGVMKACYLSTATPAGGSAGTKLADEGQSFTVTTSTLVRYGAESSFVEKTVNGKATCSNDFFGQDPLFGAVKACYAMNTAQPTPTPAPTVTPVSPSFLAAEDTTFTVSGATRVQYGANGVFTEMVVNGTATCSNAYFGMDPVPNVVKACYSLGAATNQPPPVIPTPNPTTTPIPGGQASDPYKSIDTGTDPVFAPGAASLNIAGSKITVTANRTVQTAAGVYDAKGVLIKTLWRRINLNAGQSTSMDWDYRDDFGQTVANGNYQIKVLAHNVSYKWQGVIGNSTHPGAAGAVKRTFNMGGIDTQVDVIKNFHRGFHTIASMAIGANGKGFLALGYNEAQNALHRFDVSNPNIRYAVGHDDLQRIFEIVATDGNIGYFVNTGSYGQDYYYRPENFIVGFRADGSEVSFPSGAKWTEGLGPGNQWQSVIDLVRDGGDRIQGIAVESNGNNLYVAHKNSGIKILNKTTGQCRSGNGNVCNASFGVPNPSAMALAPNGDLWVVANGGKEIRRYTNPGTNPALAMTITGLGNATGLGVSPLTSTLVVVDSGSDQQIKAYSTQNGAQVWIQGAKGGYANGNPEVSATKLTFFENPNSYNYVAFEPVKNNEEVFWIGEPGNKRNLKFKIPNGASGMNPLTYLDTLMYIPVSYSATVDKSNPTRVFSEWMEFQVDYSKPFTQSWKLVKNWGYGVPANVRSSFAAGLHDVYTTPQGRTYAIASGANGNRLYEMASNGLRDTGVTLGKGMRLHEDGSLRFGRESNGQVQVVQKNLLGIDGNGNPQFGAETVVASAPQRDSRGKKNPFATEAAHDPLFPKTSSGVYVTFNPNGYGSDADTALYHLGGLKAGGSDYGFCASPGGSFNLQGNGTGSPILNGDGTFNVDRAKQNYLGSVAMTAGRHIIYNYYGEFWNDGQANQWMHWLENGLFLGQFGSTNYPQHNQVDAIVGAAGNTFSPSMVKVDGNIYIYHNDESVHAGVHRWRVQNLNSIQEVSGNMGKGVTVTNPSSILSSPISQ